MLPIYKSNDISHDNFNIRNYLEFQDFVYQTPDLFQLLGLNLLENNQ